MEDKIELPSDEWIYEQANRFIEKSSDKDADELQKTKIREAFRLGIIIYWNKLNGRDV